MKGKMLILLAMGASLAGFAQKDEIKTAAKAMKTGDAAGAKTALMAASGSISGADEKMQAQYYALLGDAHAKLSEFNPAIEAYKKTLSIEEKTGKQKYSAEIKQKMSQMTADLINSAVEDNSNKDFKTAAEKLYQAYTLSPKDTIYLYYAASSAVQVGPDNYDQAIQYYEKLKEINYDGSGVKYTAVNVATGEVEELDKSTRDLYVKAGTHKDPKEEKTESKRAEVVKNIALIYQQQGKNEEALAAYEDAIASNPDDVNLVLNKANLYYSIGEKDKFKELMAQASAMDPNNPDLLYNIGVINMEQGDLEGARAAYEKALEIDPNYINAMLNLSTSYVNEGNGLIDEMNNLGTSRADTKKYDELKAKKDSLFKKGAQILEDALVKNPDNEGILSQLKNIYGALGDNDNFMRIKGMME
ncbi:tetratricopeptide repeat protein [Flavobacterium sp. ASW18X]|uniref:tetratricopeptide repeat protein n=1 Tax=Flavobacterium sp. ASW18X TaxID=2572595 RepID=UPI0010AE22A3|nr:tetratricopeptide repeat protein [Flavobacterium sp. ASW18X]TKD63544.1 tetratricopeptide repeat protein [Flavobacterium sp. ASW18X]